MFFPLFGSILYDSIDKESKIKHIFTRDLKLEKELYREINK